MTPDPLYLGWNEGLRLFLTSVDYIRDDLAIVMATGNRKGQGRAIRPHLLHFNSNNTHDIWDMVKKVWQKNPDPRWLVVGKVRPYPGFIGNNTLIAETYGYYAPGSDDWRERVKFKATIANGPDGINQGIRILTMIGQELYPRV